MKFFQRLFVVTLFVLLTICPVAAKAASVSYQGYVDGIGWQGEVTDGMTCGTTGQNKRLESLKVNLTDADGQVNYSTHVQDIGWTSPVSDGATSGTAGSGKQIEAIKINLAGNVAGEYDVYYRSHVSDIGWMGWAKNDEPSGTAGFNKKIEALEIKLVTKNGAAPGTTDMAYLDKGSLGGHVVYKAHVQDIGWMDEVRDGARAGTEGECKQLEALQVKLDGIGGTISTRSHVENVGWQDPFTTAPTARTSVGSAGRVTARAPVRPGGTNRWKPLRSVWCPKGILPLAIRVIRS